MNNKKILKLFLCVLMLAMLLPAAVSAQNAKRVIIKDENDNAISAGDLLYTEIGGDLTLTAEDPDGNETSFTWETSDEDVATVSDGTVTGVSKGLVTITARSASKSAKATVRVRVLNAQVTDIEIQPVDDLPDDFKLIDKQSVKLKAIITPTNADIKTVTWSVACEDPEDAVFCPTGKPPATVDSNGKVTAKGVTTKGIIVVTATATDGSGVYYEYEIEVIPTARRLLILDAEYLDPNSQVSQNTEWGDPHHFGDCPDGRETCSLFIPNLTDKAAPIVKDLSSTDKYVYLAAMLDWDDCLEWTENVVWSSSNKKIADVDNTGKVTFYKAGTVTITAQTTDGSKLKATVRVTARILVESIAIDTKTGFKSVVGGKSIQLVTLITPSTASVKKLTWKSDNPAVASVTAGGKVNTSKVKKATPVVITAMATDADPRNQEVAIATITIVVYPAAESVEIYDEDSNIVNGKTLSFDVSDIGNDYQLTATVLPLEATQDVTWKSSNTKVATVDDTGLVTLIAKGTAKITATAAKGNAKSASVTIKVITLVTDITITPEDTEVRSGAKLKVEAEVTPTDAANKKIKWYSSNPSVAKITGNNKKATLTAQRVLVDTDVDIWAEALDGSGVVSNVETITVHPAVQSIKITDGADVDITKRTIYLDLDSNTTLTIGSDIDCQAYPDDAAQDGDWSVGNKKILDFDGSTFTALKVGKTTIKVKSTDGTGKTASVNVVVLDTGGGYYLSVLDGLDSQGSVSEDVNQAVPEAETVTAAEEAAETVTEDAAPEVVTEADDEAEREAVEAEAEEVTAEAETAEEPLEEASVENETAPTAEPAAAEFGDVTLSLGEMVTMRFEDEKAVFYGSNDITVAAVDAESGLLMAVGVGETDIYAASMDPVEVKAMAHVIITEAAEAEDAVTEETAEPVEDAEPVQTDAPVEEVPADDSETEVITAEETAEPVEDAEPTEIVEETAEPVDEAEEPAAEVTEPAEEPEVPAAEAEEEAAPAVEKIELDPEYDEIRMTVGETFILESDEIVITPAEADINSLSFKIENEAVAVLHSDETEMILEEGLKIYAAAEGETKLTIKAGDTEKVIRVVIEAVPAEEEAAAEPEAESTAEPEPAAEEIPAEEPVSEPEEAAEPEPETEPEPEPEAEPEEPAAEPEPAAEEVPAEEPAEDTAE